MFYTNILDTSFVYFITIFLVDEFYIQWFCNPLDLQNVKVNSVPFNGHTGCNTAQVKHNNMCSFVCANVEQIVDCRTSVILVCVGAGQLPTLLEARP